MNSVGNRRLFLYSAAFISLALNLPRLLALRKDGVIARIWHFNVPELLVHSLLNFVFCLAVFALNQPELDRRPFNWQDRNWGRIIGWNALLLTIAILISIGIQRLFFNTNILLDGGGGFRFILSMGLIAIEFHMLWLVQTSRQKEIENEQLRTAVLQSALQALKGQLNPHFFFNSLSSLSAIIRENPDKAQEYIGDLSKVYRHSLQQREDNLITLGDELEAATAYAALMKMRFEEKFQLSLKVPESAYGYLLPPMSLQPLIENAVKHNRSDKTHPLIVSIDIVNDSLIVKNNLQPTGSAVEGTSIGLANLRERFRLLLHATVEVTTTENEFIVILPLKKHGDQDRNHRG